MRLQDKLSSLRSIVFRLAKERELFPKVPDQHKPNKPLVPNGLGIVYVLASTLYLFFLHFFDTRGALPLAGCILFGGFLGLLDDWMDLRWRYKAFLPLFAAIPLVSLRQGTPIMDIPILGIIDFGDIPFGYVYFYLVIIPGIATITTNAVNQLGGLNGLETVCPSIILLGLMITSPQRFLLYAPLVVYAILAYFNLKGKIFVGNTGSFAVGITLASYAIIANDEKVLLISILPYLFNSSLILLNYFIFRRAAHLSLDVNMLHADHRRSLVTLIAHYRPSTERQIVGIISLIVSTFTAVAVLAWWLKL